MGHVCDVGIRIRHAGVLIAQLDEHATSDTKIMGLFPWERMDRYLLNSL